jgi:hypothetical protein
VMAVIHLTMLNAWWITAKQARLKEDFDGVVVKIKDFAEIVSANVGWMMHLESKDGES